MSSGLLNRSTSRISKSIPFSNKTNRHRWEKGQVVPEYKTIMTTNPSMKNSGDTKNRIATASEPDHPGQVDVT
jgi:hypothetical protein